MTPRRIIAGFCFWIVLTSVAAGAQQGGDTTTTPSEPATSAIQQTYSTGGLLPLRRVERTTVSGGRKVIIETAEAPGVEGQWHPVEEVISSTTQPGITTTRTQRDVFRFDAQRQRRLAETTESEQTRANGSTRNDQRTWVVDLDGRLTLSSGYTEERRLVSPGIQQNNTTVSVRSPEGSLREAERTESNEHEVSADVVRHDSTHLMRDPNGRWVPIEARGRETRGIGSAERVEEETVQGPNLNGALVVRDKVLTRTSESDGENRVVIETYSQGAEGFVRSDSRLALQQRIRRSTTAAADGGGSTIEEIEARDPLAPSDPMRVTRRTVVTVRNAGPGRRVTERQMFERDVNGRMVLVSTDSEESPEK